MLKHCLKDRCFPAVRGVNLKPLARSIQLTCYTSASTLLTLVITRFVAFVPYVISNTVCKRKVVDVFIDVFNV